MPPFLFPENQPPIGIKSFLTLYHLLTISLPSPGVVGDGGEMVLLLFAKYPNYFYICNNGYLYLFGIKFLLSNC